MGGKVVSVNISGRKGTKKTPVERIVLKADFGIEGDAHASTGRLRQLSLLAIESITKMKAGGLAVSAGDFAENITTEGIELVSIPVGTRLRIGEAEAEVTQIGKTCHSGCEIYTLAGDCIMPREGIFLRILKGGTVKKGDAITPL